MSQHVAVGLPAQRQLLGDGVAHDDLAKDANGQGVTPADFNSYGTRRSDHVVALRATFASNHLKNEMVGREGSLARVEPEGTVMRLSKVKPQRRTCTEASPSSSCGQNYGAGSSRDWAAKGVRLIGVKAVVCENFERIHRTHLVGMGMGMGMGILPLEFEAGQNRKTLAIDCNETFDILDWNNAPRPGAKRRQVFAAGGLLPRMKQEFLQAA